MLTNISVISTLGVPYEGETPTELVQKANLDWKVTTVPATYTVNGIQYESKRTRIITRVDNPQVELGSCGTSWYPLQNLDILKSVIDFCDANKGISLSRVGHFKDSKTIWALAHTDKCFELRGGDRISGNILLINSHEFSNGMKAKVLLDREVCCNQLAIGLGASVSQGYKHSKTLDQARVGRLLSSFYKQFSEFQQNAELLSNTKLDLDVAYSFVITNFGNPKLMSFDKPINTDLDQQPKIVKQILRLYLGEGMGSDLLSSYNTAWGLLNACSEWVQYQSKKVGGVEGHISSLWMGGKARTNSQVYQQLLALH